MLFDRVDTLKHVLALYESHLIGPTAVLLGAKEPRTCIRTELKAAILRMTPPLLEMAANVRRELTRFE